MKINMKKLIKQRMDLLCKILKTTTAVNMIETFAKWTLMQEKAVYQKGFEQGFNEGLKRNKPL